MNVKFNFFKKVEYEESILICGLPGIAFVGKLSVDYLIKELEAEFIGELYSPYFPSYVLIKEEGVVEVLRNELHYVKYGDRRIFFLTGNAQASSPEGQFEIADHVLNETMDFGVKRVYSIAAFLTRGFLCRTFCKRKLMSSESAASNLRSSYSLPTFRTARIIRNFFSQ